MCGARDQGGVLRLTLSRDGSIAHGVVAFPVFLCGKVHSRRGNLASRAATGTGEPDRVGRGAELGGTQTRSRSRTVKQYLKIHPP